MYPLGHVVGKLGQVASEPVRWSRRIHQIVHHVQHSTLEAGTDLMEYICNENNKDVKHILGKDPHNQLGLN
jgi:hypothetical protein